MKRVFTTDEMTVEEFIEKYYRADRLNRYDDEREVTIKSCKDDIHYFGETVINRHDCNMPFGVWLYNPAWKGKLLSRDVQPA